MQIEYESNKLKRLVEDKVALQKKVGFELAKNFLRRLDQLKAFQSIGELVKSGIDNPHELKGNRMGYIGWSIDRNKRVIIRPENAYDLQKDPYACKKVIIKGVVDYHGGKENWYLS